MAIPQPIVPDFGVLPDIAQSRTSPEEFEVGGGSYKEKDRRKEKKEEKEAYKKGRKGRSPLIEAAPSVTSMTNRVDLGVPPT